MPRWDYVCETCGKRVEKAFARRMDAPEQIECEACGGDAHIQFGSAGFVLKGTGFHRNDYRGRKR